MTPLSLVKEDMMWLFWIYLNHESRMSSFMMEPTAEQLELEQLELEQLELHRYQEHDRIFDEWTFSDCIVDTSSPVAVCLYRSSSGCLFDADRLSNVSAWPVIDRLLGSMLIGGNKHDH